MQRTDAILEFWFGKSDDDGFGQPQMIWFAADEARDADVRRLFVTDFEAAAAGQLTNWETTPQGALALILLLDQCSNNIFRANVRAFETDSRAREVARRAIERGFDQQFPDVHRWFFYLPLEHSEDAADQQLSVELFGGLAPTQANQMALDYAVRHQRVITRFGRFPNRNAALGRESTAEELEFLAGPDAPF